MPERRTLTEAERQAAGWIVRINAHDATDRDLREFEVWRNANPEHAHAYGKMECAWGLVASMQHLKGQVGANAKRQEILSWRACAFAAAASLFLAIVALTWFVDPPRTIVAEAVETGPGELRIVTLADGSTMELSAGSEAFIRVTEQVRRVEITSGQVLFDVTRDPEKPFMVDTPRGEIRVLGTSFVVHVSDTRVRATVLRGSVNIVPSRSGFISMLLARAPVTASANEEIVLDEDGAEVAPVATENISRRLAWRDHMLVFDGETLNEAIAEVSRQTGWRFEISEPALGEMRIGGYVHADPEAFMGLLSSSLDLEARRDGDRRVIISHRS